MKKMAYIVPYFGKFPKGFELWLISCKKNPTIDWIIITDDKTEYQYPDNVKVKYSTFEDMRSRIQSFYEFDISLDRPYKLCEYRPAYGEIFEQELKNYDFWGHCDIDLLWGDIRKFITTDIMNKYDRIGNYGHSTFYRNTKEVNLRYRTICEGLVSYKEAFSKPNSFAFDEYHMERLYDYLKIPFYRETNFANLTKYEWNFHLGLLPIEDEYKNKRQIFTYENGQLLRLYLYNKEIKVEEYMYVHFWCRPMSYRITNYEETDKYIIYSDVIINKRIHIDKFYIWRKGIKRPLTFYSKSIWKNRRKITFERIIFNLKGTFNVIEKHH